MNSGFSPGPDHEELAVRDVEDAHQPVLQIQPERDERVDAPGDETGGEEFEPGGEGHVIWGAGNTTPFALSLSKGSRRHGWMGFDRLSPNGWGWVMDSGPANSAGQTVCHFHAGLLGFKAAVATDFGHTTSNSPFCH